jgi:predicted DNA-binding ribbon-helix-helix protein
MSSLVATHSIDIAGHKTSVSLETVFWQGLQEIAKERRETLSGLVSGINANRKSANLSSAIRFFVLRFYRDQVDLARMVA